MLPQRLLGLLGVVASSLPGAAALRLPPDSEGRWAVDAATHAALPPVAWDAAPRSALLEVRSQDRLQGHPHHKGHLPKCLWLFGAHHKSGTILMNRMALILGRTLDQPTCSIGGVHGACGPTFAPSCWDRTGVHIWFDCHLSALSLERVRALADGALRAVHIVRDPVALVVSGYVYHVHSNDGMQGTVLRRVNLTEGMALEAKAALEGPLPEMLAAYREGAKGGDVLVVRLEEFMNSSASFNATARRLFNYAVGDRVEKKALEALVNSATSEDLNRHSTSGHSSAFTDPELKRQAELAFEGLPKHLLDRLYEFRSALGYTA